MRSLAPTLVALGASLVALGTCREAHAQADTRDYRRLDRRMPESRQDFMFELRLGPYKPRVDEEFSNGATPYRDIFGNGNSFYFGFEIDWQALRIPYLGTVGPGFSWGYTKKSAKAKITNSDENSAEDTTLSIQPMYLAAVLRIDTLTRNLSIPLVPYAKAGLGLGLWSASTDAGVSKRDGITGRGRSWGTHFALGVMLHLDFLEPGAALTFDDELGVNNTYLYAEYLWSDLGTMTLFEDKTQMRVGNKNWTAGLAFEF